MKPFLASGDFLFNPSLLSYAVVETDTEGLNLRLGFLGTADAAASEVRLGGLEARSVLRWLRRNAEFLDQGGPVRVGPTSRTAITPVAAGRPS
jgi:hypothetical protein